MSTYFAKASELQNNWLVIDATNLVLGRLAAKVAYLLKGKHKPSYTPHLNCGDKIVIVNAENIALTGKKKQLKDGKLYYRHTGYPGGIKETTAGKILAGQYPERVIIKAVERMLTRNNLGRALMRNLYVYKGMQHPHTAQQPITYDFSALNRKNFKNNLNK